MKGASSHYGHLGVAAEKFGVGVAQMLGTDTDATELEKGRGHRCGVRSG
jgi:hypothetical protein